MDGDHRRHRAGGLHHRRIGDKARDLIEQNQRFAQTESLRESFAMAKNNVITKKCSMLPNLVIGSIKTHETDSAKFIFESTAVFNDPYEMNFQMGCSSSATPFKIKPSDFQVYLRYRSRERGIVYTVCTPALCRCCSNAFNAHHLHRTFLLYSGQCPS